jgi:hypothetical protein
MCDGDGGCVECNSGVDCGSGQCFSGMCLDTCSNNNDCGGNSCNVLGYCDPNSQTMPTA